MKTLAIPYDESVPFSLGESPEMFEKESAFLLALKLFELRRLSAGKVAELCGLSKPEFLFKAGELKVPVVSLDKDQIEKELNNPEEILIVNTGPLIALSMVDKVFCLRHLYREVVVPMSEMVVASSAMKLLRLFESGLTSDLSDCAPGSRQ